MKVTNKEWSHEDSYKGLGISTFIHRARLKKIFSIFSTINIPEKGSYADFGCSNGYIIAKLRDQIFEENNWKLYGFDYYDSLLKIAKEKDTPNTEFNKIDLNQHSTNWEKRFDIVSCFETIEHLGKFRNAISTIIMSCKNGGTIIISIPNENNLPGLLKFLTRKIVRRNTYGSFFDGKSQIRYLLNLILNRSNEAYRSPDADGWGPHLGFDWRSVKNHIDETYISEEKLILTKVVTSFLRFNYIFVYKKL